MAVTNKLLKLGRDINVSINFVWNILYAENYKHRDGANILVVFNNFKIYKY
jgi:hypothetical protein